MSLEREIILIEKNFILTGKFIFIKHISRIQ